MSSQLHTKCRSGFKMSCENQLRDVLMEQNPFKCYKLVLDQIPSQHIDPQSSMLYGFIAKRLQF